MPDGDPETASARSVDEDFAPGAAGDWHGLLLRMAGVLPDHLLSEARIWLAEGLAADVAQVITFAATADPIPLRPADLELMANALAAAGEDSAAVRNLQLGGESELSAVRWVFAPTPIVDAAAATLAPLLMDLTVEPGALDPIDQAAVTAAGTESEVTALYRAWRVPADGSSWPPPRRVFLVTAAASLPEADLLVLTARLQQALLRAGEPSPQVETTRANASRPVYQSRAWARSALLWSDQPVVPIRLARVFDVIDPERGPSFAPDHPVIDDPAEIGRLLDRLDAAIPVLSTTALIEDIVDPDADEAVPLTFRTDGEWVWTDLVSHYLERYGLAPEENLLAHLRSADRPLPVSEVALHRVLAFLQRPDRSEALGFGPPRP